MKKEIIEGYKGVMDLDLSLVSESFKSVAVKQHYKDIEDYKKYQAELKPEHRYENTIERIKKLHQYESDMLQQRNKEKIEEQNRHDQLHYEIYQRLCENK
tara:strand:+ start:175 stop:474 length:300 start_codon:yes stop_codon:yes gene_type:complete